MDDYNVINPKISEEICEDVMDIEEDLEKRKEEKMEIKVVGDEQSNNYCGETLVVCEQVKIKNECLEKYDIILYDTRAHFQKLQLVETGQKATEQSFNERIEVEERTSADEMLDNVTEMVIQDDNNNNIEENSREGMEKYYTFLYIYCFSCILSILIYLKLC